MGKIEFSEVVNMGFFNVTSDKFIVTDPCYDRSAYACKTLTNVRSGVWRVNVLVEEKHKEFQASKFTVAHTEVSPFKSGEPFTLAVDSGQVGIFDEAKYPHRDDEAFWDRCCTAIVNGVGEVMEEGVALWAGCDGLYKVETSVDQYGKVVCLTVDFNR